MNRRIFLAALGVGGTLAFTTLTSAQNTEDATGPTVPDAAGGSKQITIWRDPGCGCCDTYADYLEENGYEVTRVDDRNFDKRSIEVGVPEQGLGCHLAEIEGYYVSGLVPVDILERLVADRPEITGITLPGMPANAPGMASVKTGTLKTYAFGEDGLSVYSDE
ncbi:MAG: DUF411 domain-containing protein [Roseovarius sp.]|nr:DUF411 domain-containing protein [Roseovarius sp.]